MTAIVDENDPRLVFVPIEKATTPPSGLIECLKDQWWQLHPSKGIVFWNPNPKRKMEGYGFPQCNSNPVIVERFGLCRPWAQVTFLPVVFRRVDPHDYI